MKKTPQNNPPIIKEQESKPIDFSKNPELEEKYDSEKAEIKNETEQKLALATTGQLQAVILSMDKIWMEKWEKSFDEEIILLIKNNTLLNNKKISQIIKTPKLTEELLKLLDHTSPLNKRQQELKNYLWPLNNFYKRSAKLLWKEKLEEKDLLLINNEKKSFSKEFEKTYKKWEKENPEKKSSENEKIESENKKIESKNKISYFYDENEWELFIKWKDWDFSVSIPIEDKPIMQDKESTKNYIDFINTLDELWLSKIWFYRNDILINLNTKIKTTWINLRDNYLWKNEQMIFINYILKSLWKNTIKANNIEEYKNSYKNNFSNMWEFKNNLNKIWKSNIEEQFFKKFIKNWDFNESNFIENTQKKS